MKRLLLLLFYFSALALASMPPTSTGENGNDTHKRGRENLLLNESSKRMKTESGMPIIQEIIQEMIENTTVSKNKLELLKQEKGEEGYKSIFKMVYSTQFLRNLMELLADRHFRPSNFIWESAELKKPFSNLGIGYCFNAMKLNDKRIMTALKKAFKDRKFKLMELIVEEYPYIIKDEFLAFLINSLRRLPDSRHFVESLFRIFSLVPGYVPFYATELLLIMLRYYSTSESMDRLFASMDCSVFDRVLVRKLIFNVNLFSKDILDYFRRCYKDYKFDIPALNDIASSGSYDTVEGLILVEAFLARSTNELQAKLKYRMPNITSPKSFRSILIHCIELEIDCEEFFIGTLQHENLTLEEKKKLAVDFLNQHAYILTSPTTQPFRFRSDSVEDGTDIANGILYSIGCERKRAERRSFTSPSILEVLFDLDQGWLKKFIMFLRTNMFSLSDQPEPNDIRILNRPTPPAEILDYMRNILFLNQDQVKEKFLAEFFIKEASSVIAQLTDITQSFLFLDVLFVVAQKFDLLALFWNLPNRHYRATSKQFMFENAPLNFYFMYNNEAKKSFLLMKLFNLSKLKNKHLMHTTVANLALSDVIGHAPIEQNTFKFLEEQYDEEVYVALFSNDLESYSKALIAFIKNTSTVFNVIEYMKVNLNLANDAYFGLFAIDLVFRCVSNQDAILNYFSLYTVASFLFVYGKTVPVSFGPVQTLNGPIDILSNTNMFVEVLEKIQGKEQFQQDHFIYILNLFYRDFDRFMLLLQNFSCSPGSFFFGIPLDSVFENFFRYDQQVIDNTEYKRKSGLLEFFSTVFTFIYGNKGVEYMEQLGMKALQLELYNWVFTESKFQGNEEKFWEIISTNKFLNYVLSRDLLFSDNETRVYDFVENFYLQKERNAFWNNYFPTAFEERLFEASLFKDHMKVAKFFKAKNLSLFVKIEYANKDIEIDCSRYNHEDFKNMRFEKIENQSLKQCLDNVFGSISVVDLSIVPTELLHLGFNAIFDAPGKKTEDFVVALFAKNKNDLAVKIFRNPAHVCKSATLYASYICSKITGNLPFFVLNSDEGLPSSIFCTEVLVDSHQHPYSKFCQRSIRIPNNETPIEHKLIYFRKVLDEIVEISKEDLDITLLSETDETLLSTTIENFREIDSYSFMLYKPFIVYLDSPIADDHNGLFRDWTLRITEVIINRNFKQTASCELFPKNHFDSNESFIAFRTELELLGKVLGLAIKWNILVNAPFPTFIWNLLMGFEIADSDLIELDKSIRNLDNLEAAEVYFEDGFYFQGRVFQLQGEGLVGPENVVEYRQQILTAIKVFYTDLCAPIVQGFNEIIPTALIRIFKPSELKLMINGVEEIDVTDWQNNTEYEDCSADDPVIRYFWEVVTEMTNDQRKQLLRFFHGSDRLPKHGFGALMGDFVVEKFTIVIDVCIDRMFYLPRAQTW